MRLSGETDPEPLNLGTLWDTQILYMEQKMENTFDLPIKKKSWNWIRVTACM